MTCPWLHSMVPWQNQAHNSWFLTHSFLLCKAGSYLTRECQTDQGSGRWQPLDIKWLICIVNWHMSHRREIIFLYNNSIWSHHFSLISVKRYSLLWLFFKCQMIFLPVIVLVSLPLTGMKLGGLWSTWRWEVLPLKKQTIGLIPEVTQAFFIQKTGDKYTSEASGILSSYLKLIIKAESALCRWLLAQCDTNSGSISQASPEKQNSRVCVCV